MITLMSYGQKHGLRPPANLYFDATVLPNPFQRRGLRLLDGRHQAVQTWLRRHLKTDPLIDDITAACKLAQPITVAVGCLGGRHRSVAVVEMVAEKLRMQGYQPIVGHRDVDRA